jgi:hypothetical protein
VAINAHRRRDRKWARGTRVWLDGVEITNDCFYADRRRGAVRVYVRDAQGHHVFAGTWPDRRPLTAELRGRVMTRRLA